MTELENKATDNGKKTAVKTAVDAAVGIEVAAVNVFVAGMSTR